MAQDPEIAAAFGNAAATPATAAVVPDPEISAAFSDHVPAGASAGAPSNFAMPENPVSQFIEGFSRQTLGGIAAPVAGGIRGLWDLALGRGSDQASADIGATERGVQAHLGIDTPIQRAGAAAASSNWNPLNWPGIALSWAGHKLGGLAEQAGAPPIVSASAETAPTAAALLLPFAKKVVGAPYEVEAETGAASGSAQSLSAAAADGGALKAGAPEPLGAPVEGGLDESAQEARQATLARVGLQSARESAIAGDAKDAAVDYQMTKYDQPAGRAAAAQFQHEREALAAHTEGLIGDAGGTIGMDEDALANRGATIARPFDMLRQWFQNRTQQLYAQADERAGAGVGTSYDTTTGRSTLTNLDSVDRLLADPSFKNTLMAKNQQGLLGAVQSQLENFRQQNPGGFTASGAEQFRQWLNQVWTPDNKWAVGQLKDTIDGDVTSAAGEDIYQQARAIRALRAQTLDNPKGISQLFDVDPNTPINRATALEKIPDKLTQLPLDQYTNVLQTLKSMPDELQPDAQAAIGEIKGHLLNKLLQAGTQTSRGVGADIWGTDRVANVLRTNAAKFRVAFGDDTQAQAGIEDLSNAGQILRVNPSYPGADAQAANAMKRGLISRTIGRLGGVGGAAVGGHLGPLGAAVGAGVGEGAGLAVAARGSERAALKAWGQRVRPIEAP